MFTTDFVFQSQHFTLELIRREHYSSLAKEHSINLQCLHPCMTQCPFDFKEFILRCTACDIKQHACVNYVLRCTNMSPTVNVLDVARVLFLYTCAVSGKLSLGLQTFRHLHVHTRYQSPGLVSRYVTCGVSGSAYRTFRSLSRIIESRSRPELCSITFGQASCRTLDLVKRKTCLF
jgi:hypothetical protein